MDLVESADGCNLPGSASAVDRVLDLLGNNKISYEQPTVPSSGDLTYLTQLSVFSSTTTGFNPRAENFVPNTPRETKDKIRLVLKLLNFREQYILVQYWSPRAVGRHQLLTTLDQPFGLGVLDEGLCLFRKESENCLLIVDKDLEEDDCSPPARVFRRGLPEWSPNITSYLSKDFPRQSCAINCNLCGYLALPVFDSATKSCIGVLELLMSSNSTNYAFAVQQVHTALQTENLTTSLAFDFPTSLLLSERRQKLDIIFNILKNVCDIHNLPLAQTWAVSSSSTFVSHDQIIDKSCNSFNTNCIGKVCMFTAGLPSDVQDPCKWKFREECRERHLEKSRGVVGRAMSSQGLCFCGDVTKLNEEEYPLVHYAHIYKLSSCFAIFLRSLDGDADYVLEFFLPLNIKDNSHIHNVVQTLKEKIGAVSRFELGDTSSIEIVGPSRVVSNPSLDTKAVLVQSFSNIEAVVESVANMDSANILNRCLLESNYPQNSEDILTNKERLAGNDVIDAGKSGNHLKKSRKRIMSISLEAVEQQVGKRIDEAAKNFGVSRSTFKRICRGHGISSWPRLKSPCESVNLRSMPQQKDSPLCISFFPEGKKRSNPHHRKTNAYIITGLKLVVISVKRWSGVTSKHHVLQGKWWLCGQHHYYAYESHFKIYQVARLIVRLKRWRKMSLIRPRGDSVVCVNTGRPEDATNIVNPSTGAFLEQHFDTDSLLPSQNLYGWDLVCDGFPVPYDEDNFML